MTDPDTPQTTGDETALQAKTGTKPERETLFSEFFTVSHQLKAVLEPVQASPTFVSQLRGQLNANVEHTREVVARHRQRRRRLKWMAIGVGSAVYLVGLGIVLIRTGRWLLSRRQRAPETPKE